MSDVAHGPSRVHMEGRKGAFSYQGPDPFWTEILGKWESRQDRQSPTRAQNWVLLVPCNYLAHFDTHRQVVVFEPKDHP